mmetsp:Transcript_21943/g.41558  ORF Transcript_21943/g.41558 Transcript_21943/m.41558 type:complete len:527 (-) Transcript_21943:57-1637(-)
MALPRISTILGVTIVASLSFNIVLYATRFTSSSVLALRGIDPLEEELGLQLLYFSCHQIEDKADCLGQCHWCGDGGGIYDETPSGERFACVPTRNPCADPKKRTTVTKNEQQKSQRQQQHVIIPAKDLPNVNPHDMQALQRLVSNKKNNRVHKQQSSVEIKANDLPNLDPNEVDTLRHLMDPQSESPRAPLVKGQSDMQEHPFKKQRMMPKKVITIPEIDRSEARARNVERFQARKAEYNAMTESEQAQLLVRHNTDFYRYRYYSPVISEKFKLMFVPIPKVACTQWLQLFRRMAGQENWQERVGGLPYTPDINGLTYLSDYNLTEATNILKSSEWTRFVFVRDPKERFLSAYLDKVVNTQMVTLGSCCPHTRDCVTKNTTFREFYNLTQTCNNEHWEVQSQRLPANIWDTINFVGHMENLEQDARRLLEQVGAWEEYGSSGWGKDGKQAIFATEGSSGSAQEHATRAEKRMRQYYTPEIERGIEQRYREDYQNPLFQLTRRRLFFDKQKERKEARVARKPPVVVK